MKHSIQPAILYFGTPVVVLTTENEDRTFNLAPISSVFWLGWRAVLGISTRSKTVQNLRRTGQVVLNLPSAAEAAFVDPLALTTGVSPVPEYKQHRGYRFEADKFAAAGVTPAASETVRPPGIAEFPVHMEAVLEAEHGLGDKDPAARGGLSSFEVRITRVLAEASLRLAGETDRIDPDRWNPLIMSFQKFYGLAHGQVHPSKLSSIPEASYSSGVRK